MRSQLALMSNDYKTIVKKKANTFKSKKKHIK